MSGNEFSRIDLGILSRGRQLHTFYISGEIASGMYWLKSQIGDKIYYRQIAVVELIVLQLLIF